MKRVFLIVLDSFGVGEAPDAAAFGDAGANTLATVSRSPAFHMEHLAAMGLGNLDGVTALPKTARPTAAVARMRERSAGKDTTIGHWEIAGLVSQEPLPTYPRGFPPEIIAAFTQRTGRGVLCNRPYSGTDVIRDYGAEHLKTGKLIVYTSADSVFQIAPHSVSIAPGQNFFGHAASGKNVPDFPHADDVHARAGHGVQYRFARRLQGKIVSVRRSGEARLRRADKWPGNDAPHAVLPRQNTAGGTAIFIQLLRRDQRLMGRNLVETTMEIGRAS